MSFDGVIFDLDGTLWDACQAVADSWTHSLRTRYGIERRISAQESRSIMGMTEQGVMENIFATYGARAKEICHQCIIDEGDYISRYGANVYPGLEDMFKMLTAEAKLFIVSNCQCGYIEAFLICSGLGHYITSHQCEGSTGLTKGENIRLIIDSYSLKAPVYIGDTVMDETAAAAAGCPFIHAGYGFGTAKQPLGVIQSPAQLTSLLKSL